MININMIYDDMFISSWELTLLMTIFFRKKKFLRAKPADEGKSLRDVLRVNL